MKNNDYFTMIFEKILDVIYIFQCKMHKFK